MPRRNGTGPSGAGARTGRGAGGCPPKRTKKAKKTKKKK